MCINLPERFVPRQPATCFKHSNPAMGNVFLSISSHDLCIEASSALQTAFAPRWCKPAAGWAGMHLLAARCRIVEAKPPGRY
jgi:hypothetical protein